MKALLLRARLRHRVGAQKLVPLAVRSSGLTFSLLAHLGGRRVLRAERIALAGIAIGVATYYAVGIETSIAEAHDVSGGASFHHRADCLVRESGLLGP